MVFYHSACNRQPQAAAWPATGLRKTAECLDMLADGNANAIVADD